tara:strand:+ start:852 stop:1313 length:462 start_codon:yes stop_codon:yes gene_type:complete
MNNKSLGKNKNTYISQIGRGYYPGVEFNRIGGLTEIVNYSNCNNCIDNNSNYLSKATRNTPPVKPFFTNLQKGGSYNYIINPESGKKVSIFGKIGKKIINKYLNKLGGANHKNILPNIGTLPRDFIGEKSNLDPNMNNRTFDCKQPIWNPPCV